MKNYFFTIFLLTTLLNQTYTLGFAEKRTKTSQKSQDLSDSELQKLTSQTPSVVLRNKERQTNQTPINNIPVQTQIQNNQLNTPQNTEAQNSIPQNKVEIQNQIGMQNKLNNPTNQNTEAQNSIPQNKVEIQNQIGMQNKLNENSPQNSLAQNSIPQNKVEIQNQIGMQNKLNTENQTNTATNNQNQLLPNTQTQNPETHSSPQGMINNPMGQTDIQNTQGRVHEIKVSGHCDDNLLRSFGINRAENRGPEIAKAYAKSFCRLNRTTCCNGFEIFETAKVYAEAAYELKKKFEILEEITVLFQGEQYKELLYDIKPMTECHSVLEQNAYFKDFKGMDDFIEEGLPSLVDKIHELTLDVQNYVKKNLWFYSNLVCTICSPLYSKYFNLNDGQTTITANYSNCSEFIEMNEFEIRTIDIYQNIIKLFVDLAKCKNEWTENPDYAIDEMNNDKIIQEKKDFYDCYESSDFTTQNCRNICTKRQFDDYNFPIPIFKILGQALKVLFEEMAGMDVEEFYRKIKGIELSKFTTDNEIQFFKKNEYFMKFDLDKPVWDLKINEGVTIYNDHMGKKYFLVEREFGRILSVFIFTFALLWI